MDKYDFHGQLKQKVDEVQIYVYDCFLKIATSEISNKPEMMRMAKDLQCKCETWAGAFEALHERIESAIEDEQEAERNNNATGN